MKLHPHNIMVNTFQEYGVSHLLTPIPQNTYMHNHPFFEFYIFISGAEYLYVNDHMHILEKNDLLIFPPFQIHGMPGSTNAVYDRMSIYIYSDLVNRLGLNMIAFDDYFSTTCFDGFLKFKMTEEDVVVCKELVDRISSRQKNISVETTMADYSDLLQFLLIVYRTVHSNTALTTDIGNHSFVSSVLKYIHKHYQESLSLASLANTFCVSKSHLSHEFQKQIGYAVYEYILTCRILRSCEQLSKDKSLNEISYYSGFSDYSGYLKAFRKVMQCSPSEYRKTNFSTQQKQVNSSNK